MRRRTHKLDSILHEENRHIIPHNIKVALVRIKPDSESTNIAHRVGGAFAAGDGGEADEHGCLAGGVVEEGGVRELGDGGVEGEVAVGAGSAGVDDAFGDALVVERGDL